MRLDHGFALAVTGYVGIVIVLAPAGPLGLLGALLLVGILVFRESAAAYASNALRARIDLFVYLGLVLVVAVVLQRALEILRL